MQGPYICDFRAASSKLDKTPPCIPLQLFKLWLQDGEEAQQPGVSKQESKQKAARKAAKESQKSEAEAERQRRAQLELLLMDEHDLKDASKMGVCCSRGMLREEGRGVCLQLTNSITARVGVGTLGRSRRSRWRV